MFTLPLSLIVNSSFGVSFELKTGAQDSAPKYFMNNGVMTGLCVEIMQAISKENSNIKFSGYNKFFPFKRIKLNMKKGAFDIFLGFSRNPEREKIYHFVDTPLYSVKYIMAVKSNDNINIQNFEDIRSLGKNGAILTLFGTADVRFLKSQGGLTIDDGGFNLSSQFVKLLANRGRLIYYHNIGLAYSIKKEGYTNKIKMLPSVFKTAYHYAAFSKKSPLNHVTAFEETLKKIQSNGVLDEIYNRYTSN
ncbi:substrate-binding periplasmic protein [Spartinivicinus poritis]|uniref:Transporter substrate-binding domain-containing protein n=1 Tax=Spartinivicinus poritis TaxID=2994640 RepID=A0ABT5UF85_9GAMM|nr:transporter substrate-binding domain-containing protein [Spartinivicinus sp. A2-2]MDE1464641.1 transporter substrate-binding domain-containing protein [Spartinivicinus sp. A2-2]